MNYEPSENFKDKQTEFNERYISRLKPNPHGWPIIDKWNQKYVWQYAIPEAHRIVQTEMDSPEFQKAVVEEFKKQIFEFADVVDVGFGTIVEAIPGRPKTFKEFLSEFPELERKRQVATAPYYVPKALKEMIFQDDENN